MNYKDELRLHGNIEIHYFGGPLDGFQGWVTQAEADAIKSPLMLGNTQSGFNHRYDVVWYPGDNGNLLHCYHKGSRS